MAVGTTKWVCTLLLFVLVCGQSCLAVNGKERILESELHRRQVSVKNIGKVNNAAGKPHVCDKFSWIDSAVDIWFKKIEEFRKKKMKESAPPGLEAVLEDMRKTQWSNGVKPGKTEVVLKKVGQGVNLTAIEIFSPNAAHKPPGTVRTLQDAITTFEKEIADAIPDPLGEVRLFLQFEDFPLQNRNNGPDKKMSPNWLIPVFSMCTATDTLDVPVPDFSMAVYPEMKRDDSSWKTVRGLLLNTSDALPWDERENALFWRGAFKAGGWDNGPRAIGAHLFQNSGNFLTSVRDGESQVDPAPGFAELLKTDWKINLEDTGFIASNAQSFVPVEGWCKYKYLLHLPGFSCSLSLKYKLACGSVVIWYEPNGFRIGAESDPDNWPESEPAPNGGKVQWREFYYPALKNMHHAIMLDPVGSGQAGITELLEKMAQIVLDTDKSRKIAANAYDFMDTMFSKHAISCYWRKVLLRYIPLYQSL